MPVTVSRQLLGTGRVVGEEGRGCSRGPWGLSGFHQLTSSQTVVPNLPAYKAPAPYFSTMPHYQISLLSKLPPTVLYSSAHVALSASAILSCTHKHTSTQSLQNTHSQARLPQYPPTYVLTLVHTLTRTRICHSYTNMDTYTHSPVQTCPILSHACLHIPTYVPTRV